MPGAESFNSFTIPTRFGRSYYSTLTPKEYVNKIKTKNSLHIIKHISETKAIERSFSPSSDAQGVQHAKQFQSLKDR